MNLQNNATTFEDPMQALDRMRVLGTLTTRGKASLGTNTANKSTFYLHKVSRKDVMPLLARLPPGERAAFLDAFARHRAMSHGERLPQGMELVYSLYPVGRDNQLSLVEYPGSHGVEYLFMPQKYFDSFVALRAKTGARGRKVGRKGFKDPWGVRRAGLKRRKTMADARARPGGVVGAGMRNAFGVLKARMLRTQVPTNSRSARARARTSMAASLVGRVRRSRFDRQGTLAFLERRAQAVIQEATSAQANRYMGQGAGNRLGATAFLERRAGPSSVPAATPALGGYAGHNNQAREAARWFLAKRAAPPLRRSTRAAVLRS